MGIGMTQRIVVESDDTANPNQWQAFSDYLERAGWARVNDSLEWVNEHWSIGMPPHEAMVAMAMAAAGMDRVPHWHRGVKLTPMMRRALREDGEP